MSASRILSPFKGVLLFVDSACHSVKSQKNEVIHLDRPIYDMIESHADGPYWPC